MAAMILFVLMLYGSVNNFSSHVGMLNDHHKKLLTSTVKPVQNGHSQIDRKLVFKTNYCLMQVKCSKESILQYLRPSLSYHLSFRPLFCLFLVAVSHRSYCTLPKYISR